MRLCTYNYNGIDRVGLVLGNDNLADVTTAYAAYLQSQDERKAYELADVIMPPSMLEIIEGGDSTFDALITLTQFLKSNFGMTGPRGEQIFYPLNGVKLRAPVPRPPKILGPNWNHKNGQEGVIRPPGEPHPFYAIKLGTSVTGPFDPIEIPNVGRVVSEVEAAAVIGKKGKNIPAEKAEEYIFGYTILNDVTATELRDKAEWLMARVGGEEQVRFTTAARYKCFDTFCPMGPWIVTRDEIDIHQCHMESLVNNELDHSGSIGDMVFNFFQLIAYFSKAHTLEPGDVISSGTVPLAPERKSRKLAKIDLSKVEGVLESKIQGIGSLMNPIKHIGK